MNVDALTVSARRASALLKAMGNPHRLMILCQLVHGEKSVGELERIVGLSQSALSQHLARLRRDGLVKDKASGADDFLLSLRQRSGDGAGDALPALLLRARPGFRHRRVRPGT